MLLVGKVEEENATRRRGMPLVGEGEEENAISRGGGEWST